MRLMGEPNKERPLDRYVRIKNNINLWYDEIRQRGLSEEQIKILEPYYLPNYGVPASQEDLMLICMDKDIAHFTLKEANGARKTVAKKYMEGIPILREKFISQCPDRNFGEYVWETTMGPQMGYAFSKLHSLAYTFVGIQTLYLATNYPSIYWNCACLIVNSGGTELLNQELDEQDVENHSVNYGKIGTALGKSKRANITVLPPDINKSDLVFSPDVKRNAIIYGLKGITRIGTGLIYEIIKNRPYISLQDFLNKVKVNKTQAVSLIKSGAFDELDGDRVKIMNRYIDLITDKKKRITLQNMQMLIQNDLIPKEYEFQVKVFNFNKYLKNLKRGTNYALDDIAINFYLKHYDAGNLISGELNGDIKHGLIGQQDWDKIYKKEMEAIRNWMRKNQEEILAQLNQKLIEKNIQKYATGDINKWDMDALGTYCHEHELAKIKKNVYHISAFEELSEQPVIKSEIRIKDSTQIKIYEITRICGTVVDKDKNKGNVILLTPTNQIVTVKVWKNQFAKWDRQLSRVNADGTKTVIEKSFFERGNKLIISGFRRDDDFVPKVYKSSPYPLFEKIISIDTDGYITDSAIERANLEE